MSDFDFIDHYGDDEEVKGEQQLDDNEIITSLNCAIVGVGGGGGKMAKAFLDLGFNKTLLVNTTPKDIPEDVDEKHVVGSHHRLVYPMTFEMLTNLFRVCCDLGGVPGIDPVQQSRYLKVPQLKLIEVRRRGGLKRRGGIAV